MYCRYVCVLLHRFDYILPPLQSPHLTGQKSTILCFLSIVV